MPEKPLLHVLRDSRFPLPVSLPRLPIPDLSDAFLCLPNPFIQIPQGFAHAGPPTGLREPGEPVSEALTGFATVFGCGLHDLLESSGLVNRARVGPHTPKGGEHE